LLDFNFNHPDHILRLRGRVQSYQLTPSEAQLVSSLDVMSPG
jgi:hypothetical protein